MSTQTKHRPTDQCGQHDDRHTPGYHGAHGDGTYLDGLFVDHGVAGHYPHAHGRGAPAHGHRHAEDVLLFAESHIENAPAPHLNTGAGHDHAHVHGIAGLIDHRDRQLSFSADEYHRRVAGDVHLVELLGHDPLDRIETVSYT